jgi:hypothetical protein
MSDHALDDGATPIRPPRALTAEASLARLECVDCGHWEPGPIVHRGNTRGLCRPLVTPTPADFGCDLWRKATR